MAEKRAKGPGGRRFGSDPGRPLGDHPVKGGAVVAKNGRYGPYVSHNGVNATLPADKTPETVSLEEAVALVDARAERTAPAPHARPTRDNGPAQGTPREREATQNTPPETAPNPPTHHPRSATNAP